MVSRRRRTNCSGILLLGIIHIVKKIKAQKVYHPRDFTRQTVR